MGEEVLPKVDAVTSVEDNNGKVVLHGIGRVTYSRIINQVESL